MLLQPRCHKAEKLQGTVACKRRAGKKARAGTAAVEFAIVVPFLAILMLGTVDFGRFAKTGIVAANAARSGAYYGSISKGTMIDTAGIKAAALGDTHNDGYADSSVTVAAAAAPDPVDPSSYPGIVTVTVSIPFATAFGYPSGGATIARTCVMRVRDNP